MKNFYKYKEYEEKQNFNYYFRSRYDSDFKTERIRKLHIFVRFKPDLLKGNPAMCKKVDTSRKMSVPIPLVQ